MTTCQNIRVRDGYGKNKSTYYPVVIIGAGETGLALACQMKRKLGFDQFRIFDRQSRIGGTWWINQYPGIACDVPSAFYSYSFEPFHTSKGLYPTGSEFFEYLHRVAAKYKIIDKIQLNVDVSELRYGETDQEWEIVLTCMTPGFGDLSGRQRQEHVEVHGKESVYLWQETVRAKIVVSAVGILVEPNTWPTDIPGRETFKGPIFSPARWQADANFDDKNVIVVGTGSSAAQVVPALLEEPYKIKSLTQIMRTPPWVMPKLKEPFGKDLYARYGPKIMESLPFLSSIFRFLLFLLVEVIWLTVFQQKNVKWRAAIETKVLQDTRDRLPEEYHAMMTPGYPYGCKRRVFDSAWLESMSKPNFKLTNQRLKRLEANRVVLSTAKTKLANPDKDGNRDPSDVLIPADIIIIANGFEATHWLQPLSVHGRNGKSLHETWKDRGGPQAYMGVSMDGFPNFFMNPGPNIANGHSSLILTSESLNEYILQIIEPILQGEAASVEPTRHAVDRWASRIQRDLRGTVFPGCASWYYDEKGFNSVIYPYVLFHTRSME